MSSFANSIASNLNSGNNGRNQRWRSKTLFFFHSVPGKKTWAQDSDSDEDEEEEELEEEKQWDDAAAGIGTVSCGFSLRDNFLTS